MVEIRKPGTCKKGLKILVYGESGTGKTMFGLSFPKLVAIDSEDGYSWYEGTDDGKNIVGMVDTQSYDDLRDLMEQIDDGKLNGVETLVIDSETKIYENIKEALQSVEEERALRKGRDVLDANISIRSWGKIAQISTLLQNIKLRLASKGINVISVAQNKDITEDAGGGNRVKVGNDADMKKQARYDYDVVLRLVVRDGKHIGIVEKDRTKTYKDGDEILNPSYKSWEKVLTGERNSGETIEKDYSKSVEKSKEAYTESVKNDLPFTERVKEFYSGLSADEQKAFVEKVVEVTGTNKFAKMTTKQQKQVIELIEAGK